MKAITVLLFSLVVSLSSAVTAQITELHYFQSQDMYPFKTSQGIWYAEYLPFGDSIVSIYKDDFTFYKDIEIPGFTSYSALSYLSDKLFNNDAKLEYIISIPSGENTYLTGIFNEDGDLVYSFGDNLINPYYYITSGQEGKPILFLLFNNGTEWGTKVYQLPGDYLQVNEAQEAVTGLAYPNPTDQLIEIPINIKSQSDLTFSVFNAAGAIVDQRIINASQEKIRIETASFKPGVYFYAGGGVNGKFVVR